MIKMDTFKISARPYAVDLGSLRTKWCESTYGGMPSGKGTWSCAVGAVWFRRRKGITVACIGNLWDITDEEPKTALEMLERHTDGRYGGNTHGRWDGHSYWGNVTLETQTEHLEILRPMLAAFPAVPAGYDGWWRF